MQPTSIHKSKILVIGAAGQIGVELTFALRKNFGADNIIASDIKDEPAILKGTGPWENIDVLNIFELQSSIVRLRITQVYLLAAVLSANGERNPRNAWDLNMDALMNVLEIAREERIEKIFWPSSIAAIAPDSTMYGVSKYSGELLCQYYHNKFGLDIRSIRYPGLISYQSLPGGGTTDYAIEMFNAAIDKNVDSWQADLVNPLMLTIL